MVVGRGEVKIVVVVMMMMLLCLCLLCKEMSGHLGRLRSAPDRSAGRAQRRAKRLGSNRGQGCWLSVNPLPNQKCQPGHEISE